jgi:hypothetical protein
MEEGAGYLAPSFKFLFPRFLQAMNGFAILILTQSKLVTGSNCLNDFNNIIINFKPDLSEKSVPGNCRTV